MDSTLSVKRRKRIFLPVDVQWWHWTLGAFLVLLITFLAPRGKSPEFSHLTEGSISQSDVIAPMDFEILKAPGELKHEREDAAGEVLPVLAIIDSVKELHVIELSDFESEFYRQMSSMPPSILNAIDISTSRYETEDSLMLAEGSEKLFKRFGFRLSFDSWNYLVNLFKLDREKKNGIYKNYFSVTLRAALLDVYAQGILNTPKREMVHPSGRVILQIDGEESIEPLSKFLVPSEANAKISTLLSAWFENTNLPEGALSASYELVQPFLSPNVDFNDEETVRRREKAIAVVPLVKGFVMKDELIVGKNIRINAEHIEKLNSLAIKKAELEADKGGIGNLLQIFGHLIFSLLLVILMWVFLYYSRKEIWLNWKLLLLLTIIIFMVHTFQALVPVKYNLSRYMFPAALGVMLIAILIDKGVALVGIVFIALIAGFVRGNDFPAVFSTVAVGGAAVIAVRQAQTRGDVMRAGLYLAAVLIPIVAAFHFMQFDSGEQLWVNLSIAATNAIFSPILVLGLVYIFEYLFNITTDLSLLELVDLNRPLLRELAIKSPGTYHHSIMVGSLAESAARKIGANALLTRAGAYYHDIGKIENREYFIENQETGSSNIHDRLSPEKSAEIVVRHVTHGLELADEYRLPEQIKAFISEHHGRSRLVYFFDKALREKSKDIGDEAFRYPGPNPQSRETGILMLADVVEAATRSMDDHSHDEMIETVKGLIRSKLNGGDLDESPLTLREIGEIQEAFINVLSGIYHQRIPYPDDKNRDLTQSASKKPPAEETKSE